MYYRTLSPTLRSQQLPNSCITWATKFYRASNLLQRGKVKVVGKPKPSSSAQERFAQQVSIGYSLAWLWLLLKSAALKIFWISAKTEFADCEASTLKYICCTLPVSYPLRLQIRRGLWTVMLPSTWSDFGLFKVTCGVAPSFDSIPQGGRWDCGTAPTASPTLPRCRRFVCNKVYFVIRKVERLPD